MNHDDDAGSIVEGKRADLAVLDRNPFAGSVYEIADTKVTTTLASGRVVLRWLSATPGRATVIFVPLLSASGSWLAAAWYP